MRARTVVVGAVAVVLLAAASTVALAATAGRSGRGFPGPRFPDAAACAAPALPGTVVDVTLVNAGGPMAGAGAMGGGTSGMMGGTGGVWGAMMRLTATPSRIAPGTVSFVATNAGSVDHELVVLALPGGRPAGTRAIGPDGKVDERDSLGEASSSCAAGAGDGIAPGASGWVTLTLARGRYELVCNLPGHYAAGMYTQVTVG